MADETVSRRDFLWVTAVTSKEASRVPERKALCKLPYLQPELRGDGVPATAPRRRSPPFQESGTSNRTHR